MDVRYRQEEKRLMPRKKPKPRISEEMDAMIAEVLLEIRNRPDAIAEMSVKDLFGVLMQLLKFKVSLIKSDLSIDPEAKTEEEKAEEAAVVRAVDEQTQLLRASLRRKLTPDENP
jgi:hypothetical protein